MPDELEKINGEDRTAMQRVIICYYPKELKDIAEFLGVEPDRIKVVYEFSELKK